MYGTIDATSEGVTTNYSIDGGAVNQAVSLAGSGDTFKQQFWQSDTLQAGRQWVYDVLHPPRLNWGWLNPVYSTSPWQRWTRTLKLERGLCGSITSLWRARLLISRRRAFQLRPPQALHPHQRTQALHPHQRTQALPPHQQTQAQQCPQSTSTTRTSRKWHIRAPGFGEEPLESTTAPIRARLL